MTGQSLVDATQSASALRSQRALLASIAAEVTAQSARLPAAEVAGWRSDAQRAYARNLAELDAQLRTAFNALQQTIAAIDSDLAVAMPGVAS